MVGSPCRAICDAEEPVLHSVGPMGTILGEEGLTINRHNNTTTQASAVFPTTEILAKTQAPSPSPGRGKMVLLSIASEALKTFQKIIPHRGTQIEP